MDLYTPPSVASGGAYAIRPYDRVCAALQKTILFSSPTGTSMRRIRYAPTNGYVRPFKKLSRFRLLRGRLWGVCNTPLQLDTCDPSKYRCDPLTGYVRGFEKWICIRHRRWRMVGRMQYAPTTGYVRSFEISMRFPNWVRVALQKTVLFSSPLGPSVGRMRYAPTTGYVRFFEIPMRFPNRVRAILRNTDTISRPEGRGRLGGGAVGATACGGDGRE